MADDETQPAVKVIFDCDIGSDADDAAALGVLHKLADQGLVEILATIHSSRFDIGENRFGAGCLDAINTYYGRPDLPIGVNQKRDVGDPTVDYVQQIATDRRYGHDIVHNGQARNMVDVYRDILNANEDVVVLTVGHPVALTQLLDAGHQKLIAERVRHWVAMGVSSGFKPGMTPYQWWRDWNFTQNGMHESIDSLLQRWPTPVFICTSARTILTGERLTKQADDSNPVRHAYAIRHSKRPTSDQHSSDQAAVLFASEAFPQLFQIQTRGRVAIRQHSEFGGQAKWDTTTDDQRQTFVVPNDQTEIRIVISKLMNAPPGTNTAAGKKAR